MLAIFFNIYNIYIYPQYKIMKKLPLFSKRAALRIVIVVGLLGLLYSLFIHFPAPVLSM